MRRNVLTPALSVQQRKTPHVWTSWLVPQRVDLVKSAFYLSIPIFFAVYTSATAGDGASAFWYREWAIIGVTLVLLAIDRVEYRFYGSFTPTGPAIALLAMRMVFIEVIAQLDGFKFSPFLYFLVPLIAVLYFGDGPGYLLAALVGIVYVMKHVLSAPGWLSSPAELQFFFIFMLGLIFSITMAQLLKRERASRAQTEHLLTELAFSHQRLKDYTEQAVELAAARERNHLAREIHDSLGHYLTVINIQLEKALVFHEQQPEQAEEAVRNAKDLAGEALQDVRHSVRELRVAESDFSAQAALSMLIERLRSSQLSIEWHVSGSESGFAEASLRTLYRVAQEGLTNVQKHAHATQVSIELQFGPEEAILRLADNGQGFDLATWRERQIGAAGHDGGYGLQGVRERLEAVGGEFTLESAPGAGTHLTFRVPKTQRVSPAPLDQF